MMVPIQRRRSIWRAAAVLVVATAVAFTVSCVGDGVVSPAQVARLATDSRSVPLPAPARPLRFPTKVDLCTVSRIERGPRGEFSRWKASPPERVSIPYAATDTSSARYGIWRFDGNGNQSHEALCLLRVGAAANEFARNFFRGRAPSLRLVSSGPVADWSVGTTCHYVDPFDDANWDVICDGITCWRGGAFLRAASEDAQHPALLGGRAPGASSIAAWWICEGGGGIAMNYNGTYTYYAGLGTTDPFPTEPGGGGEPTCGGNPSPSDTTGGKWSPNDQLRWGASICGDSLVPFAPPGWTAEQWGSLSAGEKQLVLFDDPPKWYSRKSEMLAIRDSAYAQSRVASGIGDRIDGSKQNAYQHAIWSAALTRAYGIRDAKAWTDAHEVLGWTLSAAEVRNKNMDIYNNAIGIYFANRSGTAGSAMEDVLLGEGGLCWLFGGGASLACGGP